jgi:hypothetical protein
VDRPVKDVDVINVESYPIHALFFPMYASMTGVGADLLGCIGDDASVVQEQMPSQIP